MAVVLSTSCLKSLGRSDISTDAPGAMMVTQWHQLLGREVDQLLRNGTTGVYEALSKNFEKVLISKALTFTSGRKIEAANLLGIGRNTIARKISELGLSFDKK